METQDFYIILDIIPLMCLWLVHNFRLGRQVIQCQVQRLSVNWWAVEHKGRYLLNAVQSNEHIFYSGVTKV